MKELCHPRMAWGTWLRSAKKEIVAFLQAALEPKVVWTHASSSVSIPKPLPTLVLWSRDDQELSLTSYQDNIFLQYYGTHPPELQLGGESLKKIEVPTEFSSNKIQWWNIPSEFHSSLSMNFGDDTIMLSLIEES